MLSSTCSEKLCITTSITAPTAIFVGAINTSVGEIKFLWRIKACGQPKWRLLYIPCFFTSVNLVEFLCALLSLSFPTCPHTGDSSAMQRSSWVFPSVSIELWFLLLFWLVVWLRAEGGQRAVRAPLSAFTQHLLQWPKFPQAFFWCEKEGISPPSWGLLLLWQQARRITHDRASTLWKTRLMCDQTFIENTALDVWCASSSEFTA